MKTRKLVFLAIMIALAVVLSIVESMISVIFIPGVKLGLANVITLIILLTFSEKDAFIVVLARLLIVALTYSGLFSNSFWISLTGGIFAIVSMIIIKKFSFSIYGISVLGSTMHMVGQVLAAMTLADPALAVILPYLVMLSVPTGLLTAFLANKIIGSLTDQFTYFSK
ncbi:Gx transporter family protein [Hujiaoplasma nucleasis]|uniref:Gx transporter family protein n=1 Tax=Hujiaoplasma nucleasis TaxID=2725268 RepID=A0A7L6N3S9_9MOLU|nr:Gx transporter family protein [Hujiaoplasma nucleasis]QLY40112.1 Gx transporter family protein [Hujiaoplasma nucleasis]